jgi:hypothetical protein
MRMPPRSSVRARGRSARHSCRTSRGRGRRGLREGFPRRR